MRFSASAAALGEVNRVAEAEFGRCGHLAIAAIGAKTGEITRQHASAGSAAPSAAHPSCSSRNRTAPRRCAGFREDCAQGPPRTATAGLPPHAGRTDWRRGGNRRGDVRLSVCVFGYRSIAGSGDSQPSARHGSAAIAAATALRAKVGGNRTRRASRDRAFRGREQQQGKRAAAGSGRASADCSRTSARWRGPPRTSARRRASPCARPGARAIRFARRRRRARGKRGPRSWTAFRARRTRRRSTRRSRDGRRVPSMPATADARAAAAAPAWRRARLWQRRRQSQRSAARRRCAGGRVRSWKSAHTSGASTNGAMMACSQIASAAAIA